MTNDYIAENFKVTPGKWVTIAGKKKLIPTSDRNWKRIDWWHTQATSEKEAVVLIAESIAVTYGWKYACLIDVSIIK